MALQSITEIFIGGFNIPSFKRIILHQQIDAHHNLELVCRMDVLEKLSSELGEESKQFLGETITLKIASVNDLSGYEKLEFIGIVSQIKIVKGISQDAGDEIIIIAKSPTILTDDGPHYASYCDKSLSDIVENTFKDYDQSKLKIKVNPKFNKPLHYSVQHNESCFNYTSRLAAQYGEWFYYDGAYVIFGLTEKKEIILKYQVDLKEFNLSLLPQPNNYNYHTNDYLLDEIHETKTESISPETNGYNGFVSSVSRDVFSNETTILHNPFVANGMQQRLNATIELQKKAIEINQVKFTGISDNPGISLGCIISALDAGDGKYRVTSVVHTCNETGNYENHFEAITANFDAYPYTNIRAFPKSQTQIGIVKENYDPEAIGRVKVQFPWQKKTGEMTPWIRMVALHAGSGKGFYFVPEIGEEVLVGFEEGNAESPYVMGSLYHANAKPPESSSTPNNDNTIIQTRSGCLLKFDDGKGSITLKDKSGSSISLDGSGNVSITASSGEVSINGPKEVSLISDDEVSLNGKQEVSLISDNEVSLNGKLEVSIESAAEVNIKGKMTTLTGDVEVTVEGTKAKVDGTAMTEIKGGIVKMN